jgi:hypothetical protein
MSGRFLEATIIFSSVSSSSSVIDDAEYFTALPCRCGCRGKRGLFKGKASSEYTDGSSVRNASRDIAAVFEATCRERLSKERRATAFSITAGLDVQLRFPMVLLIQDESVVNRDFNNFSAN